VAAARGQRCGANGGGAGPAAAVRYDDGGAKKMTVTAEVNLRLFWSDFWSIKYMDKYIEECMEDGR